MSASKITRPSTSREVGRAASSVIRQPIAALVSRKRRGSRHPPQSRSSPSRNFENSTSVTIRGSRLSTFGGSTSLKGLPATILQILHHHLPKRAPSSFRSPSTVDGDLPSL